MADFPPTQQQQAFLDELTTTSSHLALIARAGCGKTSSILLGVDAIRSFDQRAEVLCIAYNKAIADEVGNKLKSRGHGDWKLTQASTLHALGNGLLRAAYQPLIEGKKTRNLIAARAEDPAQSTAYGRPAMVKAIAQLVGYGKQAAVGVFGAITDLSVWYALADHYGLDIDDPQELEDVVECAVQIYLDGLDQLDVIDFDDMILLPLIKGLRVRFPKDYVFLDEAQDLSPARQALARLFVKPRTGRMIIVGDDRQAIYGFSGADANALPNLIASFNATALPLSVTWRCPKAVVREAQLYVPDIVAAPEAPEGEVNDIAMLPDVLTPGQDAVLCRNTAPLIGLAYGLIRAGIPAKVEGRSIGEGLKTLAQRWKVTTIAGLTHRLEQWEDREVAKAQVKGDEAKVEEIMDKAATLREIASACQARGDQSLGAVIVAIDALFGDDVKDAVTLATYHRSKGREWLNVYLFEHALRCPSKGARQPWQQLQEANLAYVAVTRAMRSLTYVG